MVASSWSFQDTLTIPLQLHFYTILQNQLVPASKNNRFLDNTLQTDQG